MADTKPPEEGGPEREKSATSRRVQECITEMHEHRAVFLRARQAGRVSQRLTLQFQTRVVELVEALRPFRDQTSKWSAAGPEGYEDLLNNLPKYTTAKEVEEIREVGFGRVRRETRKEPRTLPAQTLIELSHDLDDIANQVGFEPAPDTSGDPVDGGVL
jgi:hypothetical protein